MNKRVISLAMAAVLSFGAIAIADEGGSNAGLRGSRTTNIRITNRAQVSLVRVNLFDSGVKVIQIYGNPDEIQAVGGGGSSVGPVGAGGAGAGAGGPQQGAAPVTADAIRRPDNDFGNEILSLRQMTPSLGGASQAGGGPPPPGGGGGAPGAANTTAPGGAPLGGGGGGQAGRILYTRWIYNRGPSRYGFVIDDSNRVVQIEALGSSDSRVYTNRGIRFGSSFGDIIKKYGDPDGYEIANDTIVVRYLVKDKVAFRLNRLQAGKPHVVTGIVVAAGKA